MPQPFAFFAKAREVHWSQQEWGFCLAHKGDVPSPPPTWGRPPPAVHAAQLHRAAPLLNTSLLPPIVIFDVETLSRTQERRSLTTTHVGTAAPGRPCGPASPGRTVTQYLSLLSPIVISDVGTWLVHKMGTLSRTQRETFSHHHPRGDGRPGRPCGPASPGRTAPSVRSLHRPPTSCHFVIPRSVATRNLLFLSLRPET